MEHIGAGIQDLWNGILDFTSKLVIPDWASLIGLLPILLLIAIVLFFVVTLARFSQLGPRRRGVRRVRPIAPAGAHEGTPSFAPILAAVGTFLLLLGLVVKGWFLIAGLAVLILTLLYWGREAIRDYEHIERPELPPGGAAVVRTPPPGVHMPGPSFRPILVSTAVALLLVGLIAGPAVLLAGVFALIVTLVGWLRDARREYAGVVVADRTGHPPAEPIPGYPVGTLAAIAVVVAAALVLNTGVLPPKGSAAGGASPGASGATGGTDGGGASSGGSGGPAKSGGPAGSGGGGAGGAAADVTITAKGIAFAETTASAPAGKAFKLAFDNEDAGTPHNVAIHKDSPTGAEVFKGAIFPGVKTTVYDVPALPAGTYGFVCSVHPNMTGTLTAK